MPSDTVIGMPPIEATEKNPVRVCSDPSVELRNWMAVWVETDNTRDWGAGSLAVWNGASAQVQIVETIVAEPISVVKSKAKLSISPISIGVEWRCQAHSRVPHWPVSGWLPLESAKTLWLPRKVGKPVG